MLRAAGGGGTPRLLAASAVAASVTGTLTETALATVTIPAGAMGLNGAVIVVASWTVTNSANTKTMRIRFGGTSGTVYSTAAVTAVATYNDIPRRIRNRNSASSQVGSANSAAVYGTSTSALTTSSVDTSAAVDLVFMGQLTNVGETITLESYEVWLSA